MVPMRSLEGIFLLFSLIYLMEHLMLILALNFLNERKLEFLRRPCFVKIGQ